MRFFSLAAIAAAALFASSAQAADSNFSFGVTAGTLGVGPEIGYRAADRFGVRANATFLRVDGNLESDDIRYSGKIKLRSGGAMVDLYPFRGGFRISAGARVNGNKADIKATPMGPVEVGGLAVTPGQVGTILGDVKAKNFAPALTLGWGGKVGKGFVAGFEAGALLQDAVSIRNFRSVGGTLSMNPAFLANLEAERQEVQDDAGKYKIYPIVQFTLGWRF